MRYLSLRNFFLVLLLAFLFSCNLQALLVREEPAISKHNKCDLCHLTAEPRKGSRLFAEGADPSSICLNCHAYRENHHPVDFVPTESYYAALGKDFPLFDGEMRCLTCHDPHGGPGLTETPKLLRGGPYTDIRQPCFKCHYAEKYAEIDPHIMLDDNGKVMLVNDRPVCLICHAKIPNPEVDRTNDVKFRADVGFLCLRCHPLMMGEFFKYHFLVKPSKKMLRDMKKAEKELNVIFPLVPRDRITCSTCHNPHQREIMIHEPARTGADSPKRLRLQLICLACHSGK